jgi:hypothetical protein
LVLRFLGLLLPSFGMDPAVTPVYAERVGVL